MFRNLFTRLAASLLVAAGGLMAVNPHAGGTVDDVAEFQHESQHAAHR